MLLSMTAFGRASEVFETKEITVEIRSVNNRYFDCSVKIPRQFGFSDDRIKPYLSSKGISRGKVDINISCENTGADAPALCIDEEYANAYIQALKELRDRYGLKDDISVMKVAADRNVFTVNKPEADAEHDWEEVRTVLDKAVHMFLAARTAEGQRIEEDLKRKAETVKNYVNEIEKLSLEDTDNARKRIEERLNRVLRDMGINADETKILTECAVYADKIAIDEELVRLRSHFEAFDTIIASNEPAGRKLDFLMQEMNREINTIGSKCQNSKAAQTVVAVKCELEKIREQIQNIE